MIKKIKLSNEEILDKIEKLIKKFRDYEIPDFIRSLDLTSEQIKLLADHENEYVRHVIAENPNLMKELMIKFSSDKNDYVRQGLAQNPNLTEELMLKFSSDKNEFIRTGLSWNPNLTNELMIKLSSDRNSYVKRNAFKKLKTLNSLKSEDLESAYNLIRKSKYIGRENFEKTFDYIVDKFTELYKLAKMFKIIVLKGKNDLK